jgi:hypothetical protein
MARAFATLALVAGCATVRPSGSPSAPPGAFDWQTMRAEHRVMVAAKGETHKLRGLFLARRSDGRFRVRALGPGDMTLFDVAGGASGCRVIEAAREPKPELVRALCENLRSAFHLPGAKMGEPPRYDDWHTVNGHPVAWKTFLVGPEWQVEIDVRSVELDVSVDDAALPAP